MRPKISYLSIFSLISAGFIGSSFAGARLPVVNIESGGVVSARALYGETPSTDTVQAKVEVSAVSKKQEVKSRSAVVASNDVLSPNRPSNEIWARSANGNSKTVAKAVKKPAKLPEIFKEEQDDTFVAVASAPRAVSLTRNASNTDLDDQITKMVENQRARPSEKTSQIISFDVKSEEKTVQPRVAMLDDDSDDVAVRRVVVPMDDDSENDSVVSRSAVAKVTARDSKQSQDDDSENDFAKMSPMELKKAFQKTYVSENKHLSTYQISDSFDIASTSDNQIQGFDSSRDLSENGGGVRTLEIKIGFRGDDSSLSRDNYTLLAEYATLVASNPKRAVQVSIPENATRSFDGRKLAARRLAIVEQVLKDTGVADARIVPVLSSRDDDNFVLRVISNDQYQVMTQQRKDMFGDSVGSKTYKSMTW